MVAYRVISVTYGILTAWESVPLTYASFEGQIQLAVYTYVSIFIERERELYNYIQLLLLSLSLSIHTHTHTQFACCYLASKWQSLNANSGLLPPSPMLLPLLSGARQLFHPRICFTFFDEGMEVTTDHHTYHANLKFQVVIIIIYSERSKQILLI